MEATITLAEVIHRMDSGERFDIEAVTADVNRGTGGEVRTYTNCIKHRGRLPGPAKPAVRVAETPRPPHHYENSTRNIHLLGVGTKKGVRKIHLRLITRFNGKRVL